MTQPPSSGAKILETVEQLGRRLDDKFVREQQQGQQLSQILASIETLTSAVKQLQIVVRSEQEHTRRALVLHFNGADLPALAKEHGT